MQTLALKPFANRLLETLKQIAYDIKAVKNVRIGGKNLWYEKKCENEDLTGTLGETGEIIRDQGALVTNYIEFEDNGAITVKFWKPSETRNPIIAFYDKNKKCIDRIEIKGNRYSVFTFKKPTEAVYLRIAAPRSYKYKFEFGEKATDYTPAPEDYPYINQKIYDKETLNWNFHPKTNVTSFLAVKQGNLVVITATIDIDDTEETEVITLFKVPEELKGKTDVNQLINVVRKGTIMGNRSTLRQLDYYCWDGSVTISNTEFDGVYDSFNDFKNSKVQITLTYPCLKI